MTEDDNGRTDLGTLEKRLADKNLSNRISQSSSGSHPVSPSQASHHSTPNDGGDSTPRSQSHIASPEPFTPKISDKKKSKSPEPEKSEEEVEALSDMMCSLVTNNCGETRYIGWGLRDLSSKSAVLTCNRFLVGFLYFLSKRYPMGE